MGTSTSSKGPGGGSPLVPPWADVDEQGPGPIPESGRFRSFRVNLGKFVTGGDSAYLSKAIGHYAKTATGGRAVGPRRFGSMARAGGALFDTLVSFRDARNVTLESGIELSSLNGKDTDIAIDALVHALVPMNGDADRVRVAMNEALSECLDGLDEFDFSSITDEMLIRVVIVYAGRCIYQQLILDSGSAFSKAGADRIAQAESELLALVEAATEKHMAPLLSGDVRRLNGRQIEAAQATALREIWAEWEAYEP